MPDLSPYMEILSWALPPIIGALIGYITNDIAIKMLFRPLRAYHIGSVRLPFTPGIIPRQREKLAESIGVMVSRELITEDAIRRQIAAPAFRETLAARIEDLTSAVLYTPLNRLADRFRDKSENLFKKGNDVPADTQLLQDVMSSFFRSEAFFNGLDSSIIMALRSFFQLELKVLAGGDGEKLLGFVSSNFHLDGLREPVKRIAGELTVEGIRNKSGLDQVLTHESIDGICKAIDRLYPALARELLVFLKTPHIHATLERRGRTILRRLISRMNSLQRLFLAAGQYERNLEEQMDEIVDDMLAQLELAIADDTTRAKMLETLKSWLQRLSTRSMADIAGVWGESLPEDIKKGIDALFRLFQTSQMKGWGQELISRALAVYGDERIGSLLASLAGSPQEELCAVIAGWIVGLIRHVETATGTAMKFLKQLFSALSGEGTRNASEILRLEDEYKTRIDRALHRFVMGVIDTQVPSILESVDVNTLVVQKINSLDIEKVEDLILIVIRTHLKWIILFGALLGFSIGTMQVLLTKLL